MEAIGFGHKNTAIHQSELRRSVQRHTTGRKERGRSVTKRISMYLTTKAHSTYILLHSISCSIIIVCIFLR